MEYYKGFNIEVKRIKGGRNGFQYLAEAINGSDSATGDTSEEAIKHLKGKIDNIEIWKPLQMQPLNEEEIEILVQYINKNAINIDYKLRHNHYIIQENNMGISKKAICNHKDIIMDTLKNCGYDYKLNSLEVIIGDDNKYILYDVNSFDTQEKVLKLSKKIKQLLNN